jgi:hypothetical protein
MATRRGPTAANPGGEVYRSNVLYNLALLRQDFRRNIVISEKGVEQNICSEDRRSEETAY